MITYSLGGVATCYHCGKMEEWIFVDVLHIVHPCTCVEVSHGGGRGGLESIEQGFSASASLVCGPG